MKTTDKSLVLNILAGNETVRTMQPADDPRYNWVRSTWTDAQNAYTRSVLDNLPGRDQLESRLRELGAQFEKAASWQPFAVRDGQLITGQNPQSSAALAEVVIAALR